MQDQSQIISYNKILLPTIFYFASYFMILSLSYQILINEVCLELKEDDCYSSRVSAYTSNLLIFISLTGSIPALLLSGIYSSIADKYGRKVVIIMPIIGLFIKILMLLYVNILHPKYYFFLYLVASLFSGMLGSQINFNMGIFTYTADTTQLNISSRSKSYTIVEICMITPKILGYLSSGLLAKYYGYTVPLLLTLVFTIISFIITYMIPESLSYINENIEFKFINTYTNLKLLLINSNIIIKLLSISYFLFYFCLIGSNSLDILYFKHKFGWESDFIGYYETAEGIINGLSMLLISNYGDLYNKLTLIHWISIGYFFRIVFWCLFGLANSINLIYTALPFLIFSGSISPYTRTIISNNINHCDQAKSFTAFSTLQNLSILMIPLLNICYTTGININMSGMVYEIMSSLVFISFIFVIYILYIPEFKIIIFKNANRLLEPVIKNDEIA
jgi:MFS family permease